MSTDPLATLRPSDFAPWTIRGLIASHKMVSSVIAALCAVTVAVLLLVTLGPKAGAVTDKHHVRAMGLDKRERARRLREAVREGARSCFPGWGPSPTGVVNAINAGCYQAFGEDVSDTATVVQAIARSF